MSTAPARRAHPPLQNGARGDDEREEEEEEEVGDDEAEEEDEEEPRLKYQRLGGSVPAILSTDAAAAIAVADRMVALGTHNGTLHILDFQGNQVLLAKGRALLAELGLVMGTGVGGRQDRGIGTALGASSMLAGSKLLACSMIGALRDFISETDLALDAPTVAGDT
ncbi:unnamed protein product [Miscanthus lutarioriparius]|uniref:Vps41 beta-propeller domain-containing protein n=1 Tax=Miscanthus lutarioriparius TaxID=422564 RepID=A0A811QZ45_9POAL|nr:unnamed protein product [Miscanthus lutarioriparius]